MLLKWRQVWYYETLTLGGLLSPLRSCLNHSCFISSESTLVCSHLCVVLQITHLTSAAACWLPHRTVRDSHIAGSRISSRLLQYFSTNMCSRTFILINIVAISNILRWQRNSPLCVVNYPSYPLLSAGDYISYFFPTHSL